MSVTSNMCYVSYNRYVYATKDRLVHCEQADLSSTVWKILNFSALLSCSCMTGLRREQTAGLNLSPEDLKKTVRIDSASACTVDKRQGEGRAKV